MGIIGLIGMRLARDRMWGLVYALALFVTNVGITAAYSGYTGALPGWR